MTGKNRVVLPALLALGLISTNANASDPCASVLCLYGKVDDMEKQTTDLLNVIKTGHSGSIAGNPAHALDDKTMNAIIHNYVATIVLGKAGNCKETPLTKYCSRTMPERISVEEINEFKIYPELF